MVRPRPPRPSWCYGAISPPWTNASRTADLISQAIVSRSPDIAFAVAGAPLVLPQGYGGYPGQQGPLPTLDQAPAEMQSVVREMRETRAGRFVSRLYREERYRVST
ncbi:MAG: hypothetical protein ACREX8_09800 [Gammaproteobacteria bacterium]